MEWFLSGIQEKVTLALGFPMFFPQGGGETHDFHSSPKFFTLANILGVSKNRDTPKSSFLIGFSIIFTIHFGGKIPYFWKHSFVSVDTSDFCSAITSHGCFSPKSGRKKRVADRSINLVCLFNGRGFSPGHVSFTFWRAGAKSDELS